MIKRTHVRQFLAIAEAGSLTLAAKWLNVTQPTLTSSIAGLERLIGTRLFLRERGGVRLTEAGTRLLVHARAIENEFRQAEASAAPKPETNAAPRRLGVLPTVPTRLLAAMTTAHAGRRPLVLTEASDAELRRKLSAGQIDAALTILREGERSGPVLDESYVMLLPEDHRLAGRISVSPEELANETMIARRSCEILAETSRFFTRHGVRPRFFLRSANDDRCIAMVRAGMGITTAPRSLGVPGVVAVDVDGYDFRRSLGLLVAPKNTPAGDLVSAWSAVQQGIVATNSDNHSQ